MTPCFNIKGHTLGTDVDHYLVFEQDAETARPPNIINAFTFCPDCGARVHEAKEAYDKKYVATRFPRL